MDFFTSVSMNSLTESFSLSPVLLFSLAVAGFITGYLLGIFKRNKGKKRQLKLEDEMLRNHAKILSLEKNLSDAKRENTQLKNIHARRNQESQVHHS